MLLNITKNLVCHYTSLQVCHYISLTKIVCHYTSLHEYVTICSTLCALPQDSGLCFVKRLNSNRTQMTQISDLITIEIINTALKLIEIPYKAHESGFQYTQGLVRYAFYQGFFKNTSVQCPDILDACSPTYWWQIFNLTECLKLLGIAISPVPHQKVNLLAFDKK